MGGTRKGVGAYLSLSLRGREVGWGWALIKFFCLQDGRLFEVGANSRLGTYLKKYGMLNADFNIVQCLVNVLYGFNFLHTPKHYLSGGPGQPK